MRALILGIALFASSCACWGEAKHTRTCIVVQETLDCTREHIRERLPNVVPLVEHLISGAEGDSRWEGYLTGLESLGFDLVACAAQVAMDNLVAVAANMIDAPNLPESTRKVYKFTRDRTSRAQANFQGWKARRAPNLLIKTR